MQTRRDHVQAYRFATGRLSAALISGDAAARDVPLRRARLGVGLGALLAVLVCGGTLLYALISPGGATSWRNPGSVVVEKETGNRYLFLDGSLHPTVNYASALLGASAQGRGGTRPVVRTVSTASLGATPHGDPVGIVGAPDTVPSPTALLGDWSVCAVPGAGPVLDLDPGSRAATAIGDQRVLLVDPRGGLSVLWRGTLFAVPSRGVALALGLGGAPLAVPAPFLAALPSGPALTPAAIPGAGRPGPVVGGLPSRIGDVFTTEVANRRQVFVLRPDGLAPATATEAALWTAAPGRPAARAVGPADLDGVPVSGDEALTSRIPDLVAAPDAGSGRTVCARQSSGGTPAGVAFVAIPPVDRGGAPVLVPPGRGMYAVEIPAPARGDARRWLIDEHGVRHRFVSDGAVTALGLGGVPPVQVPTSVLEAAPVGAPLDPARALDPVVTVPTSPAGGGS